MAIIGIFIKQEDGGYIGTLKTLTIETTLIFEPAEKRNDLSPNFRITSGAADFGAAWERSGKSERYLSVNIAIRACRHHFTAG